MEPGPSRNPEEKKSGDPGGDFPDPLPLQVGPRLPAGRPASCLDRPVPVNPTPWGFRPMSPTAFWGFPAWTAGSTMAGPGLSSGSSERPHACPGPAGRKRHRRPLPGGRRRSAAGREIGGIHPRPPFRKQEGGVGGWFVAAPAAGEKKMIETTSAQCPLCRTLRAHGSSRDARCFRHSSAEKGPGRGSGGRAGRRPPPRATGPGLCWTCGRIRPPAGRRICRKCWRYLAPPAREETSRMDAPLPEGWRLCKRCGRIRPAAEGRAHRYLGLFIRCDGCRYGGEKDPRGGREPEIPWPH